MKYREAVEEICYDDTYQIDPVKGKIYIYKRGEWVETATKPSGKGYHQFGYEGVTLNRHQVIFYFVHRVHSNKKTANIDHWNQNKSDDRIDNLRLKPPGDNNRNIKHPNKHGVPGVMWDKKLKKFRARVNVGAYDTKEEASKAYIKAHKLIHPDTNYDFS